MAPNIQEEPLAESRPCLLSFLDQRQICRAGVGAGSELFTEKKP